MFALGLGNLYVAATFSVAAWAWFISVGAVGAKVVAFLAQVLRSFAFSSAAACGRRCPDGPCRRGLAPGARPRQPSGLTCHDPVPDRERRAGGRTRQTRACARVRQGRSYRCSRTLVDWAAAPPRCSPSRSRRRTRPTSSMPSAGLQRLPRPERPAHRQIHSDHLGPDHSVPRQADARLPAARIATTR